MYMEKAQLQIEAEEGNLEAWVQGVDTVSSFTTAASITAICFFSCSASCFICSISPIFRS